MDLPTYEGSEITTEPGPRPRPERKRTGLPWARIAVIVLSIAVWGGLIYGAYYYVTDYIDGSIRTVQETNALHVQGLNERLDSIQSELEEVKDVLADTDQILASSDSTQEALTQRISELDRQLEDLEHSLDVLRKSPNVSN